MTDQPLDPAQPLDFAQLRAAQAEREDAPPAARKEKLKIGRHEYDLVKSLTPLDMIELQEAQDSGSLRELIETVPRLVAKDQREHLGQYLLSDPDDDADRIDFQDVIDEFGKALEALTARP